MTTTFRNTIEGKVIDKDPAAVLDYSFDWSKWLEDNETISTHTVTAENDLTLDSNSELNGVVTAWLSGGTAGLSYAVTCQIVTSAGRTDERRFFVECKER